MNYRYYIDGVSEERLERVANAIDNKIASGEDEITLKNGIVLLVYKNDESYQVYDEDLNLIAEYDNTKIGRLNIGMDFIRWNKA